MGIFRKPATGILLLLSLGLLAPARSSQSLSEDAFYHEVPTVLSGTGLRQSLTSSPMSVTVIDREMIEASGARELYDLFRLIPGVQVASPSGHEHTVTYHGMADQYARRMQILVDGRSVYSPAIGGVEWSELPITLDQVERIEFIRGPNAAAYGANAFLGTISIFTRQPAQDSGTRVKALGGNDGIRHVEAWYNSDAGRIMYRISAAYRSDDGFPDRHDGEEVRILNLHADYPLGTDDSLEFLAGLNTGPREVGDADNPFYQPGHIDRTTHFEQIRWHHRTGDDRDLHLQLYHNHDDLKETHTALVLQPFDDSPTVDRIHFEAYEERHLNDHAQAVWGVSARRDKVRSPVLFGGRNDPQINRLYRIFGHLEWRLNPEWLLNIGAVWEHNQITNGALSPRIGLNYNLTPDQVLKTSISIADRTPIFFEDRGELAVTEKVLPQRGLNGNRLVIYRSRGNLKPEHIVSRELGYFGHFRDLDMNVDLRLYDDTLSDIIGLEEATPRPPGGHPMLIWDNRSAASLRGFEGSVDWRLNRHGRLIFNYAYADADSRNKELEESVPRHTFGLLAMYDLRHDLHASLDYYHLDDMRWLDSGYFIGAYDRLDLKLRYDLHPRAQLSLTVQNLLGEHEDFKTRNKADTLVFGGIRLNF